MIVADSSYLIEGLLKDASLLEEDEIITPELALYEVANTIWKHETVLKDIKDGRPFLNIFLDLIETQAIRLVRPDEKMTRKAYTLASEKNITFYDTIFVALALDLRLELRTFDKTQERLTK